MDSEKIVGLMQEMFLNWHGAAALAIIIALTETLRRVAKLYSWGKKKVYIALLPMFPETLGIILAFIPGMMPPAAGEHPAMVLKIGFGIIGGALSSKVFKIWKAVWKEKAEPEEEKPA